MDNPEDFEAEHVNSVYDVIAKHFNHTRYKPWPAVSNFVKSLPKDSVLLDLGCGNGRNMGVGGRLLDFGSDFAMPLCEIASARNFPVFCASALQVPVRDGVFDHVICIAVIHHFASVERRVQCLQEIARLLKDGGTALVTAWATEQRRGKKMYKEADQMVSWTMDGRFDKDRPVLKRYYHMFIEGEFKELVAGVPALVIDKEWYEQDNWHATFTRVKRE